MTNDNTDRRSALAALYGASQAIIDRVRGRGAQENQSVADDPSTDRPPPPSGAPEEASLYGMNPRDMANVLRGMVEDGSDPAHAISLFTEMVEDTRHAHTYGNSRINQINQFEDEVMSHFFGSPLPENGDDAQEENRPQRSAVQWRDRSANEGRPAPTRDRNRVRRPGRYASPNAKKNTNSKENKEQAASQPTAYRLGEVVTHTDSDGAVRSYMVAGSGEHHERNSSDVSIYQELGRENIPLIHNDIFGMYPDLDLRHRARVNQRIAAVVGVVIDARTGETINPDDAENRVVLHRYIDVLYHSLRATNEPTCMALVQRDVLKRPTLASPLNRTFSPTGDLDFPDGSDGMWLCRITPSLIGRPEINVTQPVALVAPQYLRQIKAPLDL